MSRPASLLRRLTDGGRVATAHRLGPAALTAALSILVAVLAPKSPDFAAQAMRSWLFGVQGPGFWNNFWYAGHYLPGYSLLFPPLGALLGPFWAGGLAAVGCTVSFQSLMVGQFGARGRWGVWWFAVGIISQTAGGRLTFTLGLFFALACACALTRRRSGSAVALAALSAVGSPVAALYAALAGAAVMCWAWRTDRRRALGGALTAAAALVPILAINALFPQGGIEPFPVPFFCTSVVTVLALTWLAGRENRVIRIAGLLYVAGMVICLLDPSPVGANVSRLEELIAGPLLVTTIWPQRKLLMAWLLVPCIVVQWNSCWGDLSIGRAASDSAAYYQPLIRYLEGQPGAAQRAWRVEVPFTASHGEAYWLARTFPLARGWLRQTDEQVSPLFYTAASVQHDQLGTATYHAWLDRMGVRYVAVSDARLDLSSKGEQRLIDSGLPYLKPVFSSAHWQVYEVQDNPQIASGAARQTAMGPGSVTLAEKRPGATLLRVNWSPYWQLSRGHGCVEPDGSFTRVVMRSTGSVTLRMSFALSRVGSRAPRCR